MLKESFSQRWRLEPKDWLTLTIAAFSLAVSAVVGYYATIKKADDIRLVINRIPLISWEHSNERLRLNGNHFHIFINAGSRAAAIVEQEYYFVPGNSTCANRRETHVVVLQDDFEPFLLKENEVATKVSVPGGHATEYEYKKDEKLGWVGTVLNSWELKEGAEGTRHVSFPRPNHMKKDETAHLKMCFRFIVSSASNARVEKIIEAYDYTLATTDWTDTWVELAEVEKPFTLYYHSGTIFSD